MPLYNFFCEKCQEAMRRLVAPDAVSSVTCSKCGGAVKRTPKPPTSMVTERLDNGIMTRTVERPADAERLYRERAQNDPRLKKE